MDRYFAANVGSTPPTLPGTAVKGYPQDGNLATNTPATIPGAYAFWQIFDELLSVVTAAGLTPDPSNLTQVAAAVQQLATGIANTAASSAESAAITAAATDATTKASAARTNAVSDVNAQFTGTHQDQTLVLGFQDYPGGRTHQWVEQSVTSLGNGDVVITYHKSFSGSAPIPQISVMDVSLAGGSSNFLGYAVTARSLTGCTVSFGVNGGSGRNVIVRADAWGTT